MAAIGATGRIVVTEPIKILLVEDHDLVRAGIRSLLDSMHGIHVVAEAGDGESALDFVDQYRPDVVLMDIALPGMNGLAATAQITGDILTCE